MASERKEYMHEWYEKNRKPKRKEIMDRKKMEDVIKILDAYKESPYHDKVALENVIKEITEILELRKVVEELEKEES